MTKEEIEEGRRLLAQYAASGVHTDRFLEAVDWFFGHATELLTLAEESRWRKVEEEPAPTDGAFLEFCPSHRGEQIDITYNAGYKGITHWRPLPRGPEER